MARKQHTPGPWAIAKGHTGFFVIHRIWSSGLYQRKSDGIYRTEGEATAALAKLQGSQQ